MCANDPPARSPFDSICSCPRQNLLLEHHGRVTDLILCKGAFTEANELADEMKTLKGYGVKGAPRGADPPITVPLFYDFKPVAYDEPLLLVSFWGQRLPLVHRVSCLRRGIAALPACICNVYSVRRTSNLLL